MLRKFVAAALAAAFFAAGALPAEAKKVLRLSTQLPAKSVLTVNVVAFKQEVEAATKGELEIQIYDSAQLYDDKDVPKAVGSGQVEIGVASLARYVGDVPAVDVFYVPFLLDADAKVRAAVAPGSPVREPLDAAILQKTGGRVLWWQAYGGTILVSKGHNPIKGPADIKGKKVRVFGKLLGTWVSANGGSPVNVVGGEQYFAYQRGTVDIGMTGPDTLRSRKLWEVMDSVTIANIADIEFVVVINEKIWQGLTEDQRKIMTDAARRAEVTLREEFGRVEAEGIDAAKQNKMTVHVATPEELAVWKKSAEAVRDEFLKGSGPLGKQVYEAALGFK